MPSKKKAAKKLSTEELMAARGVDPECVELDKDYDKHQEINTGQQEEFATPALEGKFADEAE